MIGAKICALLIENALHILRLFALPCRELKKQASTYGLEGCCYNNVSEALKTAYREADKEDFIFIGGSCFIVADLLSSLDRN